MTVPGTAAPAQESQTRTAESSRSSAWFDDPKLVRKWALMLGLVTCGLGFGITANDAISLHAQDIKMYERQLQDDQEKKASGQKSESMNSYLGTIDEIIKKDKRDLEDEPSALGRFVANGSLPSLIVGGFMAFIVFIAAKIGRRKASKTPN